MISGQWSIPSSSIRWIYVVLFLLAGTGSSFGQVSADEASNNPIGVLETQAKAGNWPFIEGMARRLAAQPDKKNNMSPWAEFYLGLAQLKRLKPEDAYIRFKQAERNATADDQRAEFRLWAAEAAHDAGLYTSCVSLAAPFESQSDGQQDQISWAKGLLDVLYNQASEDTLDALQRRFPENRRLAYWAAKRFNAPKNRFTWSARADELIERYGLTDLIGNKNAGDTINAVILLPIGIKSNDVRVTPRANQAWLDLLESFRLATSHLADSGKYLKLHFYDLKEGPSRLETLINSGDIAGADLILGPVTGQYSPTVAAFAQRYKIPMLNPLTNKRSWAADNLYCWTTEVPVNQLGEFLAQKALKMLPSSKVAIVYGPTAQDSIIAAGYRRVMLEAGKPVTLFHKVGKNSAANLPKFLLNSKVDSTGHIFAPNDEAFVKVQLPSALAYIKKKAQVLTVGDWLLSPEANYSSYEQLNFILADPHFAVTQKPGYSFFEKAYAKATQIWPSVIAAQGYEALMVFANGNLFRQWQPGLSDQANQFMTGCYDYSKGSSNTCIPLYKVVAETVVPAE